MTRVDIIKEVVRKHASELGISHQKALNELAGHKGFSDWGGLRRHLETLPPIAMAATAPRIPPLPELLPLPMPARPISPLLLDEEGAAAVRRHAADPTDDNDHARCVAFRRAWSAMLQRDEEIEAEWEAAGPAERWGIAERMRREEAAIPEGLRMPSLD